MLRTYSGTRAAIIAASVIAIGVLFVILGTHTLAAYPPGAATIASPSTFKGNNDARLKNATEAIRGYSPSYLIAAGLLDISQPLPQRADGSLPNRPFDRNRPSSAINWGPPVNISRYSYGITGSNEPAAAMHPTDPSLALSCGNSTDPTPIPSATRDPKETRTPTRTPAIPLPVRIENTDDGGSTWVGRPAPSVCPYNAADGVPTWLDPRLYGGLGAIYVSICVVPGAGGNLLLNKSTSGGAAWFAVNDTNINMPQFDQDREYLWTDHNPTSTAW